MEVLESVRSYWDEDAATYDRAPGHGARSPAERAAWSAVLARHLPAPPARVLDVGAGTGFLSLLAARLGHRVTALDLSAGMLSRLRRAAADHRVEVDAVEGAADVPPPGPFDAVMERHVLWTLPDPGGALEAWRDAAPSGRLLVFEGLWGRADPLERIRQQAREALRRLRREPPHHHAPYDPSVRARLPFAPGTRPDDVVEAVTAAGWGPAFIERLRDIEWARLLSLGPVDRLLGVTPQFLVTA